MDITDPSQPKSRFAEFAACIGPELVGRIVIEGA